MAFFSQMPQSEFTENLGTLSIFHFSHLLCDSFIQQNLSFCIARSREIKINMKLDTSLKESENPTRQTDMHTCVEKSQKALITIGGAPVCQASRSLFTHGNSLRESTVRGKGTSVRGSC